MTIVGSASTEIHDTTLLRSDRYNVKVKYSDVQIDSLCSWRLLVVEHKTNDARTLVDALRRHGHVTHQATTGRSALESYDSYDLVILDLDLPDLDGLEVCRNIRATSMVPIILVTARSSELDRVLGLQAGADDYMSKPCHLHELIARINAIMRRVHPIIPDSPVITHGPLEINISSRQVSLNGESIKLTPKEFDLLKVLASQPGKVVSRKQLMNQVWGDSWSRRTIDTHVSSLRKKLEDSSWITTVRGVGFQFRSF